MSALSHLGLRSQVVAAPMGGGPSTPALVLAAAGAGCLGFLAGAYKTPDLLAEQIAAVRSGAPAFGVNLFAPNPVPVDGLAFRRYAELIQPLADEFGIDLRTAEPIEDDDGWHDKIDLLLADPVPVVSFTFGIPAQATIDALRRAGTVTVQSVTSLEEAQLAQVSGVDLLAVQASVAGGHFATFTPDRLPAAVPLPTLIGAIHGRCSLAIIAAGGLSTAKQVAEVLAAGAIAAMVGTVLLRSAESGASEVHRAAIADHHRGEPIVTRAFTGRPGRVLPNKFTDRFAALAPSGYPALHHLTSGLRKASAAAGNPELVNLWAGTGYRDATAEPAEVILNQLGQLS